MLILLFKPALAEDRILSLDYCADQFVLALGDKYQIIGLSQEARDSHSFYRDRAEGISLFRANADIIISQKPTLIVRSWAGDNRLLGFLERLDIPIITIQHAEDPKDIDKNLVAVAKAMGQVERGDVILRQTKERLSQLKKMPRYDMNGIYLTPGAFTTGVGTFVNNVMELAGIGNEFSNMGFEGWFPIPLEQLVLKPPELIVTSFYDSQSARQNHWGVARHGFIKKMIENTPNIDVPGSMMACSGLFLVDAAEHLRVEMDKVLGAKKGKK